MNDSDVIAALATPSGRSALAIIRVSGKDSHNTIIKCIKEAEKFKSASYNKIFRYNFIENETNRIIDDITAIKYKHQYSYTGEEMVEIISHGNKLVVIEILKEIKKNGGRLAGKGEFTRRAFLNGKMDLINAEYVQQKIGYTNEIQQRICNGIKDKKYEILLKKWEYTIKEVLIKIETEIEFNEDIKYEYDDKYVLSDVKEKIEKEIGIWEKIRAYNTELKIVIAGPTNAGKSSLFNKIVGFNRSIVTEIPGTTRDTISETIIIENNEIELIDSAGIRDTDNKIEIEGIRRSKKELEDAFIVLWVNSTDQEKIDPPDDIRKKCIMINNKIELVNYVLSDSSDEINISIEKDINMNLIINKIVKKIEDIKDEEIPGIIANERHFQIAEKVIEYINEALELWGEKEKAAFYLYKILEEFEEISGRRDKEEIYNSIFEKFCIGK